MKRGLRWGGAVLGLLVLAYGGAALLARSLLDPDAVAAFVEPRVEAALGRGVEIEGARLHLFPGLGVDLTGLRIENPAAFPGPPLARIGALRLRVAFLPLLRGRVRLDRLRVDDPTIRLAVDERGRSNFRDLAPTGEAPGGSAPSSLRVSIRNVSVRDGALTWESASDSFRAAVTGLAADASVEPGEGGGWSGRLQVASTLLSLEGPALTAGPLRLEGPGLDVQGAASPQFRSVTMEGGTLSLGDATLDLSGSVQGLRDSIRTVDLEARAPALELSGLVGLLPDSLRARLPGEVGGSLDVDLRLAGRAGPGLSPVLTGSVGLDSVGLAGRSGRPVVDALRGTLRVDSSGVVALRGITGTVLRGPFSLDGSVRADSAVEGQARLVARPALAGLSDLVSLPEETTLDGRLDLRLEMSGALFHVEDARLDGSVAASGLRLVHPRLGVPVTVEDGRVDFRGRSARWEAISVGLGRDRVTTGGTLEDPLGFLASGRARLPRLLGEVRSTRLDLDSILPPKGDPTVTYARIAFAHLGRQAIHGRSAAEWADEKGFALPDSLPLVGQVRIRIDTLESRPFRLTELDARVDLAPALVRVSPARFRLFGGGVQVELGLGVGGNGPQPFSLALDADSVQGAEFLSATSPLGGHVTGTLTAHLEAVGAVDRRLLPVDSTLSGSGRVRVRNGGLEETPVSRALADALALPGLAAPSFQDWNAPFKIEGGSLRFQDAVLGTAVGKVAYRGRMGLDGSLDLGVTLGVAAAKLDSLALGRAGLLSGLAGRLSGAVPATLGLAVEGTIQKPRIRPDASLAAGALKEAAGAEIGARTDELRDTARARVQEARDSAARRLETERARQEEKLRQQAEEARRRLESRARELLKGVGGRRDSAVAGDTASTSPAPSRDTTSPDAAPLRDTTSPAPAPSRDTVPAEDTVSSDSARGGGLPD